MHTEALLAGASTSGSTRRSSAAAGSLRSRACFRLHEERTSFSPYGAPDQRAVSTPERDTIEKSDGTLVAERRIPRDSFAGHQMSTPWDPLHRALLQRTRHVDVSDHTLVLAMAGVRVEEAETLSRKAFTTPALLTDCGADQWKTFRSSAHGHGIRLRQDLPRFNRPEVMERARSRLGECSYRILTNNCEHLCAWALRDSCARPIGRDATPIRLWLRDLHRQPWPSRPTPRY